MPMIRTAREMRRRRNLSLTSSFGGSNVTLRRITDY
jgi:hypothetical protein